MNFSYPKISPALLAVSIYLIVPAQAQVEWQVSLQRLISSLKVSGKQDETASSQTTLSSKQTGEALASTLVASDLASKAADIKHRYSFETGTGYSACDVSLSLSDERDAVTSVTRVRQEFGKGERQWFSGPSNGAERLANSLTLRKGFYCSEAEKASGICQETGANGASGQGGYGAGDSDASLWMLNRSYGGEEVMTAIDYLDVIAPLPSIDRKAERIDEDTVALINLRKGALSSGARATMLEVIVNGMGGDRREKNQ